MTLHDLASHDCVTPSHPSGRTLWRLSGHQGAEEVQVARRYGGNTVQAMHKVAVA